MKIEYSLDESTGTTYAYPTEVGDTADGVDYMVAWHLIDLGLLRHSDVFYTRSVLNGFVSKSHVKGGDVFDEEIGRKVARDKLLRKYYEFQGSALAAYAVALDKYMDKVNKNIIFADAKADNAAARLGEY